MHHPNSTIMHRAIELAQRQHREGGYPLAAVVVKEGVIIAEAFATVNRDKDPTCHAEINAIRIAAQSLGSRYLDDCYLYSTYEPCPMCASAAVWAKMKGIVFGANMDDETENCHQRIKIHASTIILHGTPKLELHPDFMRDECKELLQLSTRR